MDETITKTFQFASSLKQTFVDLFGNRIRAALIILGLLLLLVFVSSSQVAQTTFFLLLLLALNLILGFLFMPLNRFSIGFELILLSTVLSSVAFGPKVGLTMGALSALVNYIANARFSIYCLIETPLYMLIGFSAFFFQGVDIVTLGVGAAIVYNLLLNVVILFYVPSSTLSSLIWSTTNIVINYFIFKLVAPIFLQVMT